MTDRYHIVRSNGTLVDLEKAVNAALHDGWQPVGNPYWHGRTRKWFQAMERPVSEPDWQVRLREPRRR